MYTVCIHIFTSLRYRGFLKITAHILDKKNAFLFLFRKLESAWIGLNDILKEREYVWDGSGVAHPFTKWYAGQPDQRSNEDCVVIWSAKWNGTWSDYNCGVKFPFVCQKEKEKTKGEKLYLRLYYLLPIRESFFAR